MRAAPMTELRELTEGGAIDGDWDDADEMRDVGESKGGERVVSQFCATVAGVSVAALEITGRMVSARVLGRRSRGSMRVLVVCCEFGCLGSWVSKCELSR